MRTYKQLTQAVRYSIYQLNKTGWTQTAIADEIGVHKSTVGRELKRNSGQRGYRPKQAQEKAGQRRKQAQKATKMHGELIKLVEEKVLDRWSPEQISGWLLLEKDIALSHERIYQHIWEDKRQGGDLYQHLRRLGKKYQKRGSNGKRSRGQIHNRVSIDDRPKVVDDKNRVGDWEIDTVIGKGHSGALVQGSGNNQTPRRAVLRGVTNEVCGQTSFVTPLGGYGNFRFRVLVTVVERKTLYTLMAKVNRKSADLVTQATIQLMKHFEKCTHSITADNGKEFSFHEEISKTLDTAFYFAHPCHSWERGLNEYTNGLIRQYFPKSTDFKSVTNEAVCNVAEKINNRPRKSLGFKTPFQAMQDSLAKYGISLVALRS